MDDELTELHTPMVSKLADDLQSSYPEFDSVLIIVTWRAENRAGGVCSTRGNHFASAGAVHGWLKEQGL